MDIHIYSSLICITAIIGGSSSHFEEPYNGQVFILPADEERQPSLALNLSEAQEWCAKSFAGSTLPNIIEDGDNVFQFMKSAISKNRLNNGQVVLVNSIQHRLDDWTWINGHDVKGIKVQNERQGDEAQLYRYGYLWTKGEYSIQASRPVDPRYYICEYGNVSECNMTINLKCYRKREARSTWFQARQNCKKGNGDLASFETLNNAILKLSLLELSLRDELDYWIGIQRPLYHLDNNGSEIRFITWKDSHRSDVSLQCLCLHASFELMWTECKCNDSHPFICKRMDALAQRIASSVTTLSAKTVRQTTSSINLPSTPSAIISAAVTPLRAASSTLTSTNDSHSPPNNALAHRIGPTSSAITISAKTVRHTTSSIDLPSIPSAIISTAVMPLRTASSTLTSTKDNHSPPNIANATIGAVVSCCILGLFIIIIVVVIIIIRKHRTRSVNSSRNVAFEPRTITTTDEFTINEKVENSKMNESTASCSASNTMYATVQPDALTNDESLGTSIVYAELDLSPKA